MAGGTARIPQRKEGLVIGVYIQPMGRGGTVMSVDAVARRNRPFLVVVRDEGTNTPSNVTTPVSSSPGSQIDRTMDYAMAHYKDLLRRLAN